MFARKKRVLVAYCRLNKGQLIVVCPMLRTKPLSKRLAPAGKHVLHNNQQAQKRKSSHYAYAAAAVCHSYFC